MSGEYEMLPDVEDEENEDEDEDEDEETSFGGTPDFKDDYTTNRQRVVAQDTIDQLKKIGFETPSNLQYTKYEDFLLVTKNGNNWFKINGDISDPTLEPIFGDSIDDMTEIKNLLGIKEPFFDEQGTQRFDKSPVEKSRDEKEREIEENNDKALEIVKSRFPKLDLRKLFIKSNLITKQVEIRLNSRVDNKFYDFFDKNGDVNEKLPKTMKEYLGQPSEEILRTNEREISVNNDQISTLENELKSIKEKNVKFQNDIKKIYYDNERLNNQVESINKEKVKFEKKLKETTTPEERKRLEKEIENLNKEIIKFKNKNKLLILKNKEKISVLKEELNKDQTSERENEIKEEIKDLNQQIESIRETKEKLLSKLPLKEKIKYFFKENGFTIVGAGLIIASIISSIFVSSKNALSKVAKFLGNGLKDLAKKFAGSIPGILGSVISFLLKSGVEALSFISKNIWLLILAILIFIFEQFKKKK